MLEFETDFSVEMKGFSAKVISVATSKVVLCKDLSASHPKLFEFGKKSHALINPKTFQTFVTQT